ncbi:guanitoxin biosynthesis heme-dependent pre-guanitoxin N-hydroxylase GntA [Marinibaculum pumilum]|uniref:Guanitoxin biosynthesis heme-dependent pre-guanitoxin N-hydroxylase GntA n=1 Tax=Marinibaculum pumilum TaxID=1766165 RepID=A0ABV7L875_9PROT
MTLTVDLSSTGRGTDMTARFRRFVEERSFPCVGAKAALGRDGMEFYVGRSLTDRRDDGALLLALYRFVERYRRAPTPFRSFVAIFEGPRLSGEAAFERALWQRLASMHRLDSRNNPWDPRVSDDPSSPHFSFSLRSEGFFVVGLHGAASRLARRFPHPTLVFNPHDQFEMLRQAQRFDPLRLAIRRRDTGLQGGPNPMATSYGEASEALQYSGRRVGADWRCPFHAAGRGASA